MRHVLVIGSDRLEPLELLLADPEVRVSAICKPKYAHLYEGKADVWPVDDVADLGQARAAVRLMLERHPVDAIVAPIERAILTAGFLRSFYGIPGLGFEQSLRCTHKHLMKKCLRDAGLPVTDFARLDRLDDLPRVAKRLGWPVVLKPAVGSGTMYISVIRDAAEFERMRAGSGFQALLGVGAPLVAERYVNIEAEYHCDSAVFGGQVRFAAVGRYHWPPLQQTGWGGSVLVEEKDDPAVAGVLELNRRALAALGVEAAVTHLEVLKEREGAGGPGVGGVAGAGGKGGPGAGRGAGAAGAGGGVADQPGGRQWAVEGAGGCPGRTGRPGGGLLVGEVAVRPGGGGIQDALQLKYGDDLQEAFVRAAQGLEPRMRVAPIEDAVGVLGLPSRNGRVKYITPAGELERLPGVAGARLFHGPGDVIQEKLTSVFFSGVCLLRAPDAAGVGRAVEAVRRVFRMEVG